MSVVRLELDVSDPVQRRNLESVFQASYSVRRALQRGALDRLRAYWAATRERAGDAAAVRKRLGLSRTGLESAARRHLDQAAHLKRWVSKAIGQHLADDVWVPVERHLFPDKTGHTQGMPGITRWGEFRRIVGRARSHTTKNKWESWRLHGTLAGHRAAYTGPDGRFYQPRRMRAVAPNGSWWQHAGTLAVVYASEAGTLILPVRLPTAPSNQAFLEHHLADPAKWHKIDLVRSQDPNAVGGWRYEAHLGVLTTPYVSPATQARREAVALATAGRSAGIDVNVSNITVASHEGGSYLAITRVARDAGQRQRARRKSRQERRRQRALERSRRAMNRDQYQLSKRQAKRARRREAAGLPPIEVIPSGPRIARSNGVPIQAYRKDQLSAGYRRRRRAQAADAAATSRARRDHARQIAGALVREHGFRLVVEDCHLGTWGRLWGRALTAFSPGVLLAALEREAAAVAHVARADGGVVRASTRTTALSQTCLCGERVAKTLADRAHACACCGLVGDRDAVSATLAAFVVFGDRHAPMSATVDIDGSRGALELPRTRNVLRGTLSDFKGRQDAPSESTATSTRGLFVADTERSPDVHVAVARRMVGTAPHPTPDESKPTSERTRARTNASRNGAESSPPIRDTS